MMQACFVTFYVVSLKDNNYRLLLQLMECCSVLSLSDPWLHIVLWSTEFCFWWCACLTYVKRNWFFFLLKKMINLVACPSEENARPMPQADNHRFLSSYKTTKTLINCWSDVANIICFHSHICHVCNKQSHNWNWFLSQVVIWNQFTFNNKV